VFVLSPHGPVVTPETGAPPVAATEMKDPRSGLIPGAYDWLSYSSVGGREQRFSGIAFRRKA
jgi:hypothetical protein